MKNKKCAKGVKKMTISKYPDGMKALKASQDATNKYEKSIRDANEKNKSAVSNSYYENRYNGVTKKNGVTTTDGITEYSNGRAFRHSDGAKGYIKHSDNTTLNGKSGAEYQWDSYDPSVVKKTTKVKKYAEGSASIEAKPKKMNFFKKLKAKEDESAKVAQSIDNTDAQEKASYKAPEPIQKLEVKKPSIGPSKSTYAPEAVKPVAVTKTEVSSKPIGWNDDGEKERVKAYQTRHGLKADGVWGKETAKYYADSQKAKSAPKKMTIKKTTTSYNPEGHSIKKAVESSKSNYSTSSNKVDIAKQKYEQQKTKTDKAALDMIGGTKPWYTKEESEANLKARSKYNSGTMATGRKGSDGNVYLSNNRVMNPKTGKKGTVGDMSIYWDGEKDTDGSRKRGENVDSNAWSTATNKNKPTSTNGFKSGAVKGETKEERVQRLMDTSSRVESMGGNYSPEQVKIAQEIQKGEKKDDELMMSTLSKIGLGGAALTAAGVALAGYKKGKKTDLVNKLTEATIDKAKSNKAVSSKLNKLAEANKAVDESFEAPVKKMKLKKAEKTEAPAAATTKSTTSAPATSTPANTSSTTSKPVASTKATVTRTEDLPNGYKNLYYSNGGKEMVDKYGKKVSTASAAYYEKKFAELAKKEAEKTAQTAKSGGSAPVTKEAAKTEVKATSRQPRNKKAETTSTTASATDAKSKFAGKKMPPNAKGGENTNTASFKKKANK